MGGALVIVRFLTMEIAVALTRPGPLMLNELALTAPEAAFRA